MGVIYSTSISIFIVTCCIHFVVIESFYDNIQSYPYIAPIIVKAIERYDGLFSNETLLCGSTIISQYWTITAGKCIEIISELELDRTDLFLRSGASFWNASKYADRNVREHNIDSFYIIDDDQLVASIKVIQGFAEPGRSKIKLAARSLNLTGRSNCEIIGYGNIFNMNTNHLKMIRAMIISVERCEMALGNQFDKSIKNTRMFCASRPRRGHIIADTCHGDIGGPVVQNGILVGIIKSEGCGGTRVSQFIKVGAFEKALTIFEFISREYMGMVFESS